MQLQTELFLMSSLPSWLGLRNSLSHLISMLFRKSYTLRSLWSPRFRALITCSCCTVPFAMGAVGWDKAAEGALIVCWKPRPLGSVPPAWLWAVSTHPKTQRANTRFAFKKEKAIQFWGGLMQRWSILAVSTNNELLFKGPFALAVTMAMNHAVSAGARLNVIA